MSAPRDEPAERRPLTTRDTQIAQRTAAWIAGVGVSPNAISVSSVVFAGLAGLCFIATPAAEQPTDRWLFAAAAACVQLRLLANMLDGMVAVQWNRRSRLGEIYNEVPDRIADAAILIGAGYAIGGVPELGLGAAVLAVFVAYLRAFGNHLGVRQLFLGPMAKPHRMAVMTAAALYCALAPSQWPGGIGAQASVGAIGAALLLICLGCVVTGIRRLRRTAAELRAQP